MISEHDFGQERQDQIDEKYARESLKNALAYPEVFEAKLIEVQGNDGPVLRWVLDRVLSFDYTEKIGDHLNEVAEYVEKYLSSNHPEQIRALADRFLKIRGEIQTELTAQVQAGGGAYAEASLKKIRNLFEILGRGSFI